LKQRIITALFAFAFFIPLVIYGRLPFTIAILLIATIGLFELLRMNNLKILSVSGFITWIALIAILMPSNWADYLYDIIGYTKIEMAFASILILLLYTVLVKNRFTFDHVAFSTLAVLYVGIGFYYLIETRAVGIEFIVYALMVIWTTDSGAYFIGRKIGKRKLWPDISPNKTIEGFFGGLFSAIVFACIFQFFIPIASSYIILIAVTIVASTVGQLGDLVESALKRHYNVKDSGKLLPGHGGILDRFDSLLFVLPLLHFLKFVV